LPCKIGRPKLYEDTTLLYLQSRKADTKLQPDSERTAIIWRIINAGGQMTIGDLCSEFGYDVTNNIKHLVRSKWLEIAE